MIIYIYFNVLYFFFQFELANNSRIFFYLKDYRHRIAMDNSNCEDTIFTTLSYFSDTPIK